jgi:hypothetical protein
MDRFPISWLIAAKVAAIVSSGVFAGVSFFGVPASALSFAPFSAESFV